MNIDRDAAWKTIVGYYAQPGVADDLLRRQQESDLDIVLFLLLRYLDETLHLTLSAAEHQEAQACIATWRNAVIKPVRQLRRELKDMAGLEAIDATARHAYRESLKQLELRAERIEFDALCQWLETRPATPPRA